MVGTRIARTALAVVLTDDGMERLEREYLGAPARVLDLNLTELAGAARLADEVNALRKLTVAEVADAMQSEFVGEVARAVPEERRATVRASASELWRQAHRAAAIARGGSQR